MKQTLTILLFAIVLCATVAAVPNKLISSASNSIKKASEKDLEVEPNYRTGIVKIKFKAKKAQQGTIVVMDENGNSVLKQNAAIRAGLNTIPINNFINLNEGAYKIYVKTDKNIYQATYLLWK